MTIDGTKWPFRFPVQVRARTSFEIASTSIGELIAMPDPEAAEALNTRMGALDQIHRIHERSYAERGIIVREFEKRHLWAHLIDPETGEAFPHLTAWLSCSDFLGCRRTNFEAKRDMELLQDVPTDKLIDVPKGNLKVLTQLSTAVRNDPGILEAAKTMQPNEFMDKVEKEQPHQHIEARKVMRFSPGRSWAKTVEEAITWAMEHDIAGSRDEALLRMAETSLNEWQLELEVSQELRLQQESSKESDMEIANDYFAVEDVIQQSQRQRNSVRGKDTPFRVEFRYRQGARSYQYFEDINSASAASDRKAGYGPTGRAHIEHPLSQVIQLRGPRGGWKSQAGGQE